MEHLLNNIAIDKSNMIKHHTRLMIMAEAERAFVFGNLSSEEDNLLERISKEIVPSWEKYRDNILESKLEAWGLGKDVILVIPD